MHSSMFEYLVYQYSGSFRSAQCPKLNEKNFKWRKKNTHTQIMQIEFNGIYSEVYCAENRVSHPVFVCCTNAKIHNEKKSENRNHETKKEL